MRICGHCGTSLDGYRRQAIYCGGPCRAAASRSRKAAQVVEHPTLTESAPKRTGGPREIVDWASLPSDEQERIEALLARHADLMVAV
jgi:hypothetical protein